MIDFFSWFRNEWLSAGMTDLEVTLTAILGLMTAAWMDWAERIKKRTPDIDKIRIEEGDTVLLRYKGFLTGEQRRALQRMMDDRFKGQARKVIVLEAGLDADVVKKREVTDDLPPPKPKQWTSNWVKDEYCDKLNEIQNAKWEADMVAWKRRRDDNRQPTQPEGDWEEKA